MRPIKLGFLTIFGKKNRTEVRHGVWRQSTHVVADAHGVMIMVLDVTHFMVVRRGDGNQRCGQCGAKHQGGQAGERLGNGFHGQTLSISAWVKQEGALYRRVRNTSLHACNERSVKCQRLDSGTTATRIAM